MTLAELCPLVFTVSAEARRYTVREPVCRPAGSFAATWIGTMQLADGTMPTGSSRRDSCERAQICNCSPGNGRAGCKCQAKHGARADRATAVKRSTMASLKSLVLDHLSEAHGIPIVSR